MFDVLQAWRGIKGFEMVGEGEIEEAKFALSLDRAIAPSFWRLIGIWGFI